MIQSWICCRGTLRGLDEALPARTAAIAQESKTAIKRTLSGTNPAVPAPSGVHAAISQAADALNLSTRRLPRGADHDAQQVAALCPMGMIFVPSFGGISHSPRELTTWDDGARGANVLLGAILKLDRLDPV